MENFMNSMDLGTAAAFISLPPVTLTKRVRFILGGRNQSCDTSSNNTTKRVRFILETRDEEFNNTPLYQDPTTEEATITLTDALHFLKSTSSWESLGYMMKKVRFDENRQVEVQHDPLSASVQPKASIIRPATQYRHDTDIPPPQNYFSHVFRYWWDADTLEDFPHKYHQIRSIHHVYTDSCGGPTIIDPFPFPEGWRRLMSKPEPYYSIRNIDYAELKEAHLLSRIDSLQRPDKREDFTYRRDIGLNHPSIRYATTGLLPITRASVIDSDDSASILFNSSQPTLTDTSEVTSTQAAMINEEARPPPVSVLTDKTNSVPCQVPSRDKKPLPNPEVAQDNVATDTTNKKIRKSFLEISREQKERNPRAGS